MTREEARIRLKNLKSDAKLYDGKAFNLHLADSEFEALEVAIKALEQEPCEDAISRQVALETLEKLPHEYKTAIQRKVTWGIEECEAIIASLPTIKQKVGKWIRVHYINDGKDTTMNKCSNCFQEFGWDIETGISFEDYKFCPNCGAKMEAEE